MIEIATYYALGSLATLAVAALLIFVNIVTHPSTLRIVFAALFWPLFWSFLFVALIFSGERA